MSGIRPDLLRSSGLLGIATAFVRLSNVGLLALLGRSEGAAAVGFYGLAMVAASLISLAMSLGFPTYMTRSVAAGVLNQGDVHRIHMLRGVTLIPGSLVLIAIAIGTVPGPVVAGFFLFALVAMLDHWNETAWALVRGTGRASVEPSVNAVGYLLVLSICVPLYATGTLTFTVAALVACGGAILRSLLAIVRVRLWRAQQQATSSLGTQIRSATTYWASDLLGLAYLRGDVAILSVWAGAVSLGHYVAATALTTPLVQVAAAMSAGALAVAARASAAGESRDATVVRFFTAYGLLVGALLSWAFPAVVPLLFGAEYSDQIVGLAAIVVMFLPLKFLNFGLQSLLLAGGQPGVKVAVLAASVIVNVALNLWWAPFFGVTGAAWATVLTEVVVLGLYLSTRSVRSVSFGWPVALLVVPIAGCSSVVGLAGMTSTANSITIASVLSAALALHFMTSFEPARLYALVARRCWTSSPGASDREAAPTGDRSTVRQLPIDSQNPVQSSRRTGGSP